MTDIVRQCIAVVDGQLVNPFTVTHQCGVFRLDTIAHALALTNRYGGHTSDANGDPIAYSVAEHCLLVEHIAELRTRHMIGKTNDLRLAIRREALVHDAAEAYIGDVAAPIKRDQSMRSYCSIELRLDIELRQWFGLSDVPSGMVHSIDVELRGTERAQLFYHDIPQWKTAPPIPGIRCGVMSPKEAKAAWLAKFWELFPSFTE